MAGCSSRRKWTAPELVPQMITGSGRQTTAQVVIWLSAWKDASCREFSASHRRTTPSDDPETTNRASSVIVRVAIEGALPTG